MSIIAQLAGMCGNQGFCRVSSPGIENQQERKPPKTCMRVPCSKKLGRWSPRSGWSRLCLRDRRRAQSDSRASGNGSMLGGDGANSGLCRERSALPSAMSQPKSFRARITPKPWRCGHHAPAERWPFLEAKSAKSFEAWESEYLRKIQDYSFVRLVERIGDGKIHAESRRCWRCTMKSRVPIAAICVWRRTDAFNSFPFHRISSLCIADA